MTVEGNSIFFAKVHKDAKIPTKRSEDAGYDIYPCFEDDYIIINKHETVNIPTGIASAFNDDYYIQIEEKGGTGSKGIKRSSGVIDSGYRGEWFISITNTNDVPLIITKICNSAIDILDELGGFSLFDKSIFYPYDKAIAQAIVHVVPKMESSEISYQELLLIESERGLGKLGSTGK